MKKIAALLLLVGPLYAQKPSFKVQVIDNQIDIGYGLAIGDVDGDRKPDILMADQKEIVWYRNPGKRDADWSRHVMAQNLTPQDNVCIAARDIDGDGKVEVAVGAGWNPSETNDTTKSGAVFYLVRPQDPTQSWEPIRLHHEITTHRMRWAKVAPNRYQLIVVPLHGLGNKNGEGRGVRILGYEKPKNPRDPWPMHLVDSTMHLTHNFEIWEDGPETRLLIGSKEGGKTVAYRKGKWVPVERWIGAGNGMGEVRRGFQNGKIPFVAAVEPMHGNKLVVYKNGPVADAPDKLLYGVQQTLTDQMNQGHALACGDFLNLGVDQIAVGWRNPNAEKKVGVRLFVPDKTLKTWQEHILDDSVRMATEDLLAADLDGDGDLDLVASGRATLNVLIYWNQLK
ncbi:VCBS repeat protein [Larkinella arboricola]|uniref:VCBS repeat protein n=1 Tax=Larkinella arboricola TaxID=643671 RepID=A0A327WRW4_LARAB|nr:VCBS repeat-containing protein [Larkinella arboricola]RAJ94042.1 VCBS repeat protein [Larkinella arboricola]